MTYLSSGAKLHTGNGWEPFASKKALREALESTPRKVLISTYGLGSHPPVQPENLTQGTRYQLAGPDPEVSRKWYGTLENRDGTLYLDNKRIKENRA